jgi:hypothetical protein
MLICDDLALLVGLLAKTCDDAVVEDGGAFKAKAC